MVGQPRGDVAVADDDRAGGAQPRGHGAILGGDPIELHRADGGPQAGDVEAVLEGHRHAVQRTQGLPALEGGISLDGLLSGPVRVQRHHGVEHWVVRGDPREVGFQRLDRGHLAAAQPASQLGRRQFGDGRHAVTPPRALGSRVAKSSTPTQVGRTAMRAIVVPG